MKEAYLFEYSPADNLLCRANPLLKLILLPAFSIITGIIPPTALLLPALILVPFIIASSTAVRKQFAGLWKLCLFFLAAGALSFLNSGSITDGAAFSSRLILITAAGLLFYSHTRLTAIRRAITKLLAPVPFIDGRYPADMITMSISFLPLIFKTMADMKDARSSRCFRSGKHPLRAIRLTTVPLMINMFLHTDEMADAWYSRGYNPEYKKTKKTP